MKPTPTLVNAALAGVFAGGVMPIVWGRVGNDTINLVLAFLLVVAVPAHAFVVGFDRTQASAPGTLDVALLKRVGVWVATAVATVLIVQAFRL